MTKQQAFNKVWDWFVRRKKPFSFNPKDKVCLYRGPKGARCAIGVLIPDDEYDGNFEFDGLEAVSLRVGCLKTFKLDFLRDLQNAHDHAYDDTVPIKDNLTEVAKCHNLTIPKASRSSKTSSRQKKKPSSSKK